MNTDNLMRLQVEQLEKEKKERESRLRVIAKRIDHIERAYRQEERPLLAKDYELQQASDRATFENPAQYSEGIPYVMVGGVWVVKDGRVVEGVFPGKGLRRRVTP